MLLIEENIINMVSSLVAQTVKCLSTMQETWVRSLGQEDPLEENTATHYSILAWEIPWAESLVDYSPWGHKSRMRLNHQPWPLTVYVILGKMLQSSHL